jgi:selenocysteine-specific elongation factor
MIIATSGHVDHGKTLLVHALTGIETDRLEEEKARGLTIDLGFAYTTIDGERIGFIDVPGHIKFISNMLAGVSAIDFGLLVIAADDGPMPQTTEHLAILDLIGIKRGAVVLTKIDRVAAERVHEVEAQIKTLCQGTFLQDTPIFPVSGTQRTGLGALSTYLVETARHLQRSLQAGHFRLAIDRSFSVKGTGQVVTGSIIAGQVKLNDEIFLAPQGLAVRVRAIHKQNQPADQGGPGDRCAINIAGPELAKTTIHRGNYLTSNPWQLATERCDILFTRLRGDTAAPAVALKSSTPVHVHSGANHVTGRLVTLAADGITPGAAGPAQLLLNEPINLWFGDKLIIRDQSAAFTLGGGRVLDPAAPGRGRATTKRLAELQLLAADQPLADIIGHWIEARQQGTSRAQLIRLFNISDAELDTLLVNTKLVTRHQLIISAALFSRYQATTLAAIEQWQAAHPQQQGLPGQQVRTLSRLNQDLVTCCLEQLLQDQRLLLVGNTYRLPNHAAALSGPVAKLWERVEPLLTVDPIKPPVLHELAKQVNLPPAATEKLLNQLVGSGHLVKPVGNRYFLPDGIKVLRNHVLETAASCDSAGFSVADFRDHCGLGRNLCIEMLEYFDRTGVTLRLGDRRKLRNP